MNKKISQAGRPAGLIGRLFGHVMAWHNQPDNEWTIKLLGISSSENILEIGYGPGRAIQKIYALCPKCKLVGIDHSEVMQAAASWLNKEAIAAGAVDLRIDDVDASNFADNTFDKAFSINCIYFWPDPVKTLHVLCRVLKVGGKLAITVRDSKREAYRPFSKENLKALLTDAGFSKVEIHSNGLPSHPLLCGIAIK